MLVVRHGRWIDRWWNWLRRNRSSCWSSNLSKKRKILPNWWLRTKRKKILSRRCQPTTAARIQSTKRSRSDQHMMLYWYFPSDFLFIITTILSNPSSLIFMYSILELTGLYLKFIIKSFKFPFKPTPLSNGRRISQSPSHRPRRKRQNHHHV